MILMSSYAIQLLHLILMDVGLGWILLWPFSKCSIRAAAGPIKGLPSGLRDRVDFRWSARNRVTPATNGLEKDSNVRSAVLAGDSFQARFDWEKQTLPLVCFAFQTLLRAKADPTRPSESATGRRTHRFDLRRVPKERASGRATPGAFENWAGLSGKASGQAELGLEPSRSDIFFLGGGPKAQHMRGTWSNAAADILLNHDVLCQRYVLWRCT